MNRKRAARVAVTMGDACGIGPEVAVRTLAGSERLRRACFLVGDRAVLCRELGRNRLSRRVVLRVASSPDEVGGGTALWLVDRPFRGLSSLPYGRESALAGRAALSWIKEAARWANEGKVGALVTAPVNKAAVARNSPGFTGQTEVVAREAGVRHPVMLLVGKRLRVIPATRHIPLARVPRALSVAELARTILTVSRDLRRWMGIARPRLAVCGLNPHAGEGGLLGREEVTIIVPAIRRASRLGARASGPHPADSVYSAALAGKFDAVVAMYHDQALIPVKTLERDETVNATLGLPFLRTSPAHGTAFDIAGKGRARCSSMRAAMEMAVRAARSRLA